MSNKREFKKDPKKDQMETKDKGFIRKDGKNPKKGKLPCFIKEIQGGNDFSWYNRNGNLTNVASSYFLSNPAGKAIGRLNSVDVITSDAGVEFSAEELAAVPGIMRFDMLPAFAPTTLNAETASVSGLNIAAKQLYAKMRKANAGARSQYEAPDLIVYVLAVESIYAFLAACVRAYGYLSQYPTNNRYYAQRILEAMGFDYDDLIDNRLEFFNFINSSIMRLKRFVIPAGFSTVNRSVWVNSNVFCDTMSTVKAQLYIPVYNAYWKFNSKGMDTGGCLELSYITSTPRTLTSLRAYFNSLIAPIAQDDDFLTLSGDIMKFTDSFFTLEPISMDLILNPIYDEDVLLQLHNSINLGLANPDSATEWERDSDYDYPSDLPANSTYTIFQKDGLLFFQPIVHFGYQHENKVEADSLVTEVGTLCYIDTPEDSPSVERVTEATRLITVLDHIDAIDSTKSIPIKTCGHEIVVAITIYDDSGTYRLPATNTLILTTNAMDVHPADHVTPLAHLSPFGWDVRVTTIFNHLMNDDSEGIVLHYKNLCTHWNTRSIGTFDSKSFANLNDIITMSLLTLM